MAISGVAAILVYAPPLQYTADRRALDLIHVIPQEPVGLS